MPSLILEGGTFRPIFSAGVMDALLDNDIMFDYVIGVSAGITNGFSYISKQKRRNLDLLLKYRNDKRYIGAKNFLKCKSIFGLDFAYDEIPNKLFPFDWETFYKYNGKILVGVTNAKTGKIEYKNGVELDTKCTMLRATCAIPLLFPTIEIDGNNYYDGGLCDPIPIKKAISDGNKKHLIILTRDKDYIKMLTNQNKVAAKIVKNKYPKLESVLLNRHIEYNKTVQFCNELAKTNQVVLIRPQKPINSFEKDSNKLQEAYYEGYNSVIKNLDDIKGLFL
ncbi:patatin family protein [Romboutsia maritimum]|uniref:Patatin family protein n=1 Tax=Romboutsia maritimum TaxID=2020948 RepID=A0A371IR64_9FIRM|nr:patatin family protein [Romboutsia maritimum]RDY22970.1 patatin family protein [Romboutsia maritimum]